MFGNDSLLDLSYCRHRRSYENHSGFLSCQEAKLHIEGVAYNVNGAYISFYSFQGSFMCSLFSATDHHQKIVLSIEMTALVGHERELGIP